jgi:uncharacterized protein YacL
MPLPPDDPWQLIRSAFPLVIALLVGTATILLVSLALPILLPVAAVLLVIGLVYLWLKSGFGRHGRHPYD